MRTVNICFINCTTSTIFAQYLLTGTDTGTNSGSGTDA